MYLSFQQWLKIFILSLCIGGFVSCAGGGDDNDNGVPSADSDLDNDGLLYSEETEVYFTSPVLADTDGDGISDGDEVNEYGFNATVNPYRFNPLIADLPTLKLNIETSPDLVLRYTDSEGTEQSESNSGGGERVKTESRSHTGGVSATLGLEIGVEFGSAGASSENKVIASVTGSYETTEEEVYEDHRTWEKVKENSLSSSKTTDGGTVRIGVSIENNSNLTYSLEHITLSASYIVDNEITPIATLGYDSAGDGFKRSSFAPGDISNTLLFSYDSLDLGTSLDILKDGQTIIVQPALYELTNSEGIPIAFDEGGIHTKTAEIIIDYGVVRPQEVYKVSMLSSLGEGAITVDNILSSILKVDYVADNGLSSVRDVVTDKDSRWVLVHTHNDGFIDQVTSYDIESGVYDLSSINIYPSDQLVLVYLADPDGDGVGIREEIVNGTNPNLADTDGDGLTDDVEIRQGWQVNAVNLKYPDRYPTNVKSSPVLADADEDGLNDLLERDRGLDPNNSDTDGDTIADFNDYYNGELPITVALSLVPDGSSSIKLTGTVSAEKDTVITDVKINWGDGNPIETVALGLVSADIEQAYDYSGSLAGDNTPFDITITVTNDKGDSVVYMGSTDIYKELTTDEFTLAKSWQEDRHIRMLTDVDGDGDLDLLGFGDTDVSVSLWNAVDNDFEIAKSWLSGGFTYDGGYTSKEDYPRYIIDYDNDGLKDIVGFGAGGVYLSENIGGAFNPSTTKITSSFSKVGGWNGSSHIRTLADVDGDGAPDIVGFSSDKVFTYLNGAATYTVASSDFTPTTGWSKAKHYRMLSDINGDGRDDILGFGYSEMLYALAQGDGTFSAEGTLKTGSQAISELNGWKPSEHPVIIEDINGDAKPDIIGFGANGVWVYMNKSSGGVVAFSNPKLWSNTFHINTGWQVALNKHPRFIADLNGDGFKDLAGFGGGGVYSVLNQLPLGNELFDSETSTITISIKTTTDWFSGGIFNSRYIGDVNNDGHADVVGFGNLGVVTQRMQAIVQPAEAP